MILGGGSLGGAAVLSAAARATPPRERRDQLLEPHVATAAWTRSRAVRTLRVPALFVAAEEDTPFPQDAQTMYEACSSPDKQVVIFPGIHHGAPLLRDPNARTLVDDFIARHSQ